MWRSFKRFLHIQICRKFRGLGCVTRALVLAWFTQPSPRIVLHICTFTEQILIHSINLVMQNVKSLMVRKTGFTENGPLSHLLYQGFAQFRALRRDGLTIRVGRNSTNTETDYILSDVTHVKTQEAAKVDPHQPWHSHYGHTWSHSIKGEEA